MSGYLCMYIGPMASGKSTALVQEIRKYRLAGFRVLVLKYGQSIELNATISNRNGLDEQCILCPILSVYCGEETLTNYDVIVIDEAQFYPDLLPSVTTMVDKEKIVVTGGLVGDFRRRPFGQYPSLLPLATDVITLHAVCMKCKSRDAAFSKRITKSEKLIETDLDSYEARCFRCFNDD